MADDEVRLVKKYSTLSTFTQFRLTAPSTTKVMIYRGLNDIYLSIYIFIS